MTCRRHLCVCVWGGGSECGGGCVRPAGCSVRGAYVSAGFGARAGVETRFVYVGSLGASGCLSIVATPSGPPVAGDVSAGSAAAPAEIPKHADKAAAVTDTIRLQHRGLRVSSVFEYGRLTDGEALPTRSSGGRWCCGGEVRRSSRLLSFHPCRRRRCDGRSARGWRPLRIATSSSLLMNHRSFALGLAGNSSLDLSHRPFAFGLAVRSLTGRRHR
jgi:hypothetical protein